MNKLNSVKHMQHFDALNPNQKKEKERNEEENVQFANFL